MVLGREGCFECSEYFECSEFSDDSDDSENIYYLAMSNIYLKVPLYVAAFYRNRDDSNPLGPFDAVEFPSFSHEAVVIAASLMFVDNYEEQSSLCYSQRVWNNILNGKPPTGGKRILQRDATEWPTMTEICALHGRSVSDREEAFDYLCIRIPREIVIDGVIKRTNSSYTLRFLSARKLVTMLRNEFYHTFADWCIQDRRHCNMVGIKRDRGEMLERFLTQYDIPVSADAHEKDSLRRLANRWFEKAMLLPNDRIDFHSDYLHHVSDDEIEKEKRRRKRMKVKADIKKY